MDSPDHSMKVVLHELVKCDNGTIRLLVSCGDEPARTFLAVYDGTHPKYRLCSLDEELFVRLSDLACRRFGNSTVYQMELIGIIAALATGEDVPVLPVTLGTTKHCTLKPGRMGILCNKLRMLLGRTGLYRPRAWVHPDYRRSGRAKRYT